MQVSLDDYLQPWSFMPWDDGVDDAANTAVAPAAAPPPSRQQPLAVADKAGKEVPVQRGRGRPKGSASKGQGKKSSAPAPGAGTRGTTLNTGNAHAQGAASLGQQPAQPAPSGSGMGTFGVKVTRTVVPVKDDVEGGDGQDGTDGPGGAQAAAWPGHVSVGSDTSMAAGGTQQGQGPRKKQCKERVAAGQKSAASPATPARTGTALPPKLQPQAGEMGGSPGAQGSPQSMDAEANPALQAFEGQLDSVIRQVGCVRQVH